MRLDHLLSKEINAEGNFTRQSQQVGRVKYTVQLFKLYGGIAQLGEHLPCKQGVKSSNLFISTIGLYSNRNNRIFLKILL